MVAQVVDDTKGHTVVSASTMEAGLRGAEGDKTAKAKRVGELIASISTASTGTAVGVTVRCIVAAS
jgi:large subunit ribosomal protein L18